MLNKLYGKIIIFLNKRELEAKKQKCYRAAFRICLIGYCQGDAQKYLDKAKDSLYAAASTYQDKIDKLKL